MQSKSVFNILVYCFRKEKNENTSCQKVKDEVLQELQCSGDFSLKDEPRVSNPNKVTNDQIKAIIDTSRRKNCKKVKCTTTAHND